MRKLIPQPEEFYEMQYRYHERLGILCDGPGVSTWRQHIMARREARQWLEKQPLISCLDAFVNDGRLEPVLEEWHAFCK